MQKLWRFLKKRAVEPTTWASVAAVVSVFRPDWAHTAAVLAGALGTMLPEGQTQ